MRNKVSLNLYATIFRVAVAIILIIDLFYLIPLRDIFTVPLYYDVRNPDHIFLKWSRENYTILVALYTLSIMCFMLGIGRILSTISLFIFLYLFQELYYYALHGGDVILRQVLLYFIFVNSFHHFSLTSWWNPFKYKFFKQMSVLAYVSIIFHLCYIFLAAFYAKIQTPSWQQGYGLIQAVELMPLSYVRKVPEFIIHHKTFAMVLNYCVLFFQLTFTPALFIKRLRNVYIIMGIVIHLSMLLLFPLVKFELIMVLHLIFGFYTPQIMKNFRQTYYTHSQKHIYG